MFGSRILSPQTKRRSLQLDVASAGRPFQLVPVTQSFRVGEEDEPAHLERLEQTFACAGFAW